MASSISNDPCTNLAQTAATKARDAAEAFFALQNITDAIKQAMAAKMFDPNLPGIENYITAYEIHSAVSNKKSWYHVLGVQNPRGAADSEAIIKKRFKTLALALHPDKNTSIAADGAFKYVKAAWDILSDPSKRQAYDKSLMSRRCTNNPEPPNGNCRKRAGPEVFKKTFKIVRRTGQNTVNLSAFWVV